MKLLIQNSRFKIQEDSKFKIQNSRRFKISKFKIGGPGTLNSYFPPAPHEEPQAEVLGFASPSLAPHAEAGLLSPAPHDEGFGSLSPVPQEEGVGLASPSFEPHEEPHEEVLMLIVSVAM